MNIKTLAFIRGNTCLDFQQDIPNINYFFKQDVEYLKYVSKTLEIETKHGFLKGSKYASQLKYINHLIKTKQ